LIGGTWKHSNVFSGPVLIARGLDFELIQRSYGVLRVQRFAHVLTSWAVIATGKHLFPFRTEKLSPLAPMVLGEQSPGRVGRRPFLSRGRRGPLALSEARRRGASRASPDRAHAAGERAPRPAGASRTRQPGPRGRTDSSCRAARWPGSLRTG